VSKTPTVSTEHLTFAQIEALWIQVGGAPAYAATMAGIAEAESGGWVGAVAGSSPGAAAKTSTDGYGGSYGLWQINGSHAGITDSTPPSQGGATPPAAWVANMENPLYNAQWAVYLLGDGSGMSAWTNDSVGNAALAAGGSLDLADVLSALGSSRANSLDLTGAANLNGKTQSQLDAFIKGVLGKTAPGLNAQFTDLKNFWNAGVWAGGAGAGGSGGSKGGQGGVDTIGPNPPDILGTVDSIGGLIKDLTSGELWIRVGEFLLGFLLVVAGGILFFKSTATGQKIEGGAASAASVAALG